MKIFMFILLISFSSYYSHAQLNFSFTSISSGFSSPVDIANDGFNADRLYIVQQSGSIKLMERTNGQWVTNDTDFLNINTKVTSGGEMGLLGLVFHPNFDTNGYFYVNYTKGSSANRKTVIERYKVNENATTADVNSSFTILEFGQPASNHNAGDLNFGPDGMLYIATGDGGGGNDPNARSQDLSDILGKMLRIDVDNGSPYAIPADNPFVGVNNALEEIWAYGLRNPWRFSFDRLTGDMWIGDVGQNALEEVDFQPAGSTGGENYGWDCYEGTNTQYEHSNNTPNAGCFDENGQSLIDHVAPVFEVQQIASGGNSITGGYVYRGSYPNLRGHYFVIDFVRNNVWTVQKNGDSFDVQAYGNKDVSGVSTFGEDVYGELYLARLGGNIYQVTSNTLPIALVEFEGNYEDEVVNLNWVDLSDTNRSHFEIERSANGVDFENIGNVSAIADANPEQSYVFRDEDPTFSNIYYRLKMVNDNGSFSYSKSIIIHFEGRPEMFLFPNPNGGEFQIILNKKSTTPKPLSIYIRNMSGALVYQQKQLAAVLPLSQRLYLADLPVGLYNVEVVHDGTVFMEQLVKAR